MAKLSILVLLGFLSYAVAFEPFQYFNKIDLPAGVFGPESVALNPLNEGPFAAVNDGRVLKYEKSNGSFLDFAITSPNRTKQLCDGVTNPDLGPTCGRILGMSFSSLTGDLYMVDAYLNGVYVVGPKGGLATLINNTAGGVPFHFLNGIDINPVNGDLYVTDASLTIGLRDIILQPNLTSDSTGRLIKIDYKTKEVTVLMSGLDNPIGPAVSMDGTFLLVSEVQRKRILKYWLKGPKANTAEVLLDLPGNPRKVKRATLFGQFWVGVTIQLSNLYTGYGYKITSDGTVLMIKDFQPEYYNATIAAVQEYDANIIYVGSRQVTFIGTFRNLKHLSLNG